MAFVAFGSAPAGPYRTEADLRDRVRLTPEEAAADYADATSPESQTALERELARGDLNQKQRGILQTEYSDRFGARAMPASFVPFGADTPVYDSGEPATSAADKQPWQPSPNFVPFEKKEAPAPRGVLGEVFTGAKRSAFGQFPQQIGQALKWLGEEPKPIDQGGLGSTTYEIGRSLENVGTDYLENPANKLNPDAHNWMTNALASGAEMVVPSIAPVAIAVLLPETLPAWVSMGLGATSMSWLYGGSQAQQTYERGIKAGLDPAVARQAGIETGAVEAGGEILGTIALGYLFGVVGKGISKASGIDPVDAVFAAVKNPAYFKDFAKKLPGVYGTEIGTEIGQNVGEAAIEQGHGIPQETSLWEQGKAAIAPTFGMTTLMLPFALVGHRMQAKQTTVAAGALEDATAPKEVRTAAAGSIYAALKAEDKPFADKWMAQAKTAIATGAPVGLDRQFAEQAPSAPGQEVPTTDEVPPVQTPAADPYANVGKIMAAPDVDAAIQAFTDATAGAGAIAGAQRPQTLVAGLFEDKVAQAAHDQAQASADDLKAQEEALPTPPPPLITPAERGPLSPFGQQLKDKIDAKREAQEGKAAEAARGPQQAELSVLDRIIRREAVTDAEAQPLFAKGQVETRADGTLKITAKGMKARQFLMRQIEGERNANVERQQQGGAAKELPRVPARENLRQDGQEVRPGQGAEANAGGGIIAGRQVSAGTDRGGAAPEWVAFPPESGTLGVPRAQMPQVKAEHRGAMVNFLEARGVTHQQETVPAALLKATQAEYSPSKVEKAQNFEGGDRSILISSDNYIADGHHQALAKLASGEPIQAIRLNAPIAQLLPLMHEFPSSTTAGPGTQAGSAGEVTAPGAKVAVDGVFRESPPVEKPNSPAYWRVRVDGVVLGPQWLNKKEADTFYEKRRAAPGTAVEAAKSTAGAALVTTSPRGTLTAKHPNVVVRDVRDNNAHKLGDLIEPYDGTEAGARKAAERISRRMPDEFPDYSNIQSRIGATDENGNPKWAISPNLAHVRPVDSAEGAYIWGDVSEKATTAAKAVTAPAERRHDAAKRKAVSDMSREELHRALLVDDLTGLGNRRAYDESPKQAVQTLIDADSLKWTNDNLGHPSGDEMLRLIGQAIKDETEHGYHLSGDEFVIQTATPEESHAIMARVSKRLAGAKITVENADGSKTELNGLGVSYGQGADIAEADHGLRRDKGERQRTGLRSDRGQAPPGAVTSPAKGKPDSGRVAPAAGEVKAADAASVSAEDFDALIQEVKSEMDANAGRYAPAPTKAAIIPTRAGVKVVPLDAKGEPVPGAAHMAGEKPAKPQLTASEIPADLKITLSVKVEENNEVHDVELNAREALKDSSRKVARLEALLGCLRA